MSGVCTFYFISLPLSLPLPLSPSLPLSLPLSPSLSLSLSLSTSLYLPLSLPLSLSLSLSISLSLSVEGGEVDMGEVDMGGMVPRGAEGTLAATPVGGVLGGAPHDREEGSEVAAADPPPLVPPLVSLHI